MRIYLKTLLLWFLTFLMMGVLLGASLANAKTASGEFVVREGVSRELIAQEAALYLGLEGVCEIKCVGYNTNAQVTITKAFGEQASKAVGDYAQNQLNKAHNLRAQASIEKDSTRAQELTAQAKQLESDWGDQGKLRLLAHTVIGGLTGGASGAAGAATGTISAPWVNQALTDAGVDPNLTKAIVAAASTTAGALVGGTSGAVTALNEVTNNYLSHSENVARLQAKNSCTQGDSSACSEAARLDTLDQQRDVQFHAACDGALIASAGCADATRDLYAQMGSYAVAEARDAALRPNMAQTNAAHKDELQSYLPLIVTANADVRTSSEGGVEKPSIYTADPYGVIDKNNEKDAYLVMKFGSEALAVGNVFDKEKGTYLNITDEWARNGMNNAPSYAAGLMLTHVDAAMDLKQKKDNEKDGSNAPYIPVDRYTLSYAPTGGFLPDLGGTLATKLGSESASILGLRSQMEAIQNSGSPVNWIVHSRGGVDFVAAAAGSGMKDLSNNSVVFHAGANTKWSTSFMMGAKEIKDVIDPENRFRDAPNDLVPQIAGLHALTAPWNFFTSLISAPCLSSTFCSIEQSPHTLPYNWPNLKKD